MSRRPTRRALIIAGIGLLLILAGATAQAGWLFVLAAGVLGLSAGSLVVPHRLKSISIERNVARRARVGDAVRVGYRATNTRKGSVPLFVLEDGFAAFEPVHVAVDRLPEGSSAEIEQVRTPRARGRFMSGRVTVTGGAPFGLSRSRRISEIESEITVVPAWVELPSFPILEPSSSPSEVLHERARTGAGEEFLGIREFRPGDSLRSVHWRSSARAGSLIVREWEEEVSSRVGLVIAGNDHGDGPRSAFETLISAVASIGMYSLSTGHPVSLVRPSHGGPETLIGPSRFELLDWLADASADDANLEPLVEAAVRTVGRRGTIVICAPTSGLAGGSIASAVQHVQRVGARAIVVAAVGSSWDESVPDVSIAHSIGDGRVPIRLLRRDEEIGRCLAA